MILTRKQEQALNIIIEKYRNREKYVVISGYAGSGKSTLVNFAVAALSSFNIDPEKDVCYAAYTGKACQVLLSKGNHNVLTLHKLLYETFPKPDGTFFRRERSFLQFKVIVADECSMIPKYLVDLLLKHNVFIIFLGDNFQLPPIDKDTDNHLLDIPDIFLDEIMRQALDNNIIRLSIAVREQKKLFYEKNKDAAIISKRELNTGALTWADQILVATNKTRISLNNQMRDLLGHQGAPQDGDKIICSRNYWDKIAENEDPLVNGTIGFLSNSYESFVQFPKYLYLKQQVKTICGIFTSDTNANFGELSFDKEMILTGTQTLDRAASYKIYRSKKYNMLLPYQFLYGYAITVHKAQGSEWDNVLITEENFPFDRTEHARWLYTAITRSSKKLVLVR